MNDDTKDEVIVVGSGGGGRSVVEETIQKHKVIVVDDSTALKHSVREMIEKVPNTEVSYEQAEGRMHRNVGTKGHVDNQPKRRSKLAPLVHALAHETEMKYFGSPKPKYRVDKPLVDCKNPKCLNKTDHNQGCCSAECFKEYKENVKSCKEGG